MNKKQMIDKIYEVIADKEFIFGCKVKYEYHWLNKIWDWWWDLNTTEWIWYCNWHWYHEESGDMCGNKYKHTYKLEKIIWHPVMIWDVLDMEWIDDNDIIEYIMDLFIEKRKPIEEQSEECIKFIYNLIKEA